jgi:hypothetical protein
VKLTNSPQNRTNERQIKYLGLVIEKDDEYALYLDEVDSQVEDIDELVRNHPKDPVKRQYFPVREQYIRIVKNSRKVCIESLEKRGRKDFRRTQKSLIKLGKLISA